MSFDTALRLVEVLTALAVLQRGAEHLRRDLWLALAQIALAGLLLVGITRAPMVLTLWATGLWQLHRFDGPYNGGSDKMILLILTCLTVAHWVPGAGEIALGYLGLQLVLSYFVSGWVKLKRAEWRSGQAVTQVFAFSAYPTSETLRGWANRPIAMRIASRTVIGFEVLFPLALLHPVAFGLALTLAFVFHLVNAVLFGLNRFVWAWVSAYPALIWLQGSVTP